MDSVCGSPGCARRVDVRYYRSMSYRGVHVRQIPVQPGWYAEISEGGDVAAYGPFESAEQALDVARAEFARSPGVDLVVGSTVVARR